MNDRTKVNMTLEMFDQEYKVSIPQKSFSNQLYIFLKEKKQKLLTKKMSFSKKESNAYRRIKEN